MRRIDVGGSRGGVASTGLGARPASQFALRPGTQTPAGFVGASPARRGRRVAYNTVLHVGRSFPGEGAESYPAERNNITPRLVRRRAEPHTPFRIQHGADIDPRMPALTLGLPWRPAPDSPPARPGGPGPNREG